MFRVKKGIKLRSYELHDKDLVTLERINYTQIHKF